MCIRDSGWGALAVEMLARALWLQRLDHLRPAQTFMLDLRRPGGVAAVSTPFARNGLSPDLRPCLLYTSRCV